MQRTTTALLCLLIGILGVVGSAEAQPTVADAVVIATNSAELNRNSVVEGNVVVNEPSSGPTLSGVSDLEVERAQMITGDLAAASIELARGVEINGNLFVDFLNDRGAVFGPGFGNVSDYVPPIFDPLPAFPAIAAPDGEVVVVAGQTLFLGEGDYGDVKIAQTGTLVLGGSYTFRSLSGISTAGGLCPFPCRSLLFSGPTVLRVAERFDLGKDSFVGPAAEIVVPDPPDPQDPPTALPPSEPFTPDNCSGALALIQIAGTNAFAADPNSLPPAAKSGKDGVVCATLHVPNGTYLQDKESVLVGAVLARDVRIDQGAHTILDSFFAPRVPLALSCNAVLDGENPILITLEGFDPDGENLTFNIVDGPFSGAIVQGPDPIVPGATGRCELSQLVCEDPGTPSGCPLAGESCQADGLCSVSARPCCPDPADTCEASGATAPIDQATVVYQPNTPCPADPETGDPSCAADSFSFDVTNTSGETSAATTCEISQPDPGAPGVIQNVQASDRQVDTPVSTTVEIVLTAGTPAGVTAVTFSIESLPSAGTLSLPGGGAVAAGDDLPGSTVIYSAPATAGSDSFLFGARETGSPAGTPCDPFDPADRTDACGQVSIGIERALELAEDQTVETDLNTPVVVNLTANPGGTGSPVPPPPFATRAAAQTWTATGSMLTERQGHRTVRVGDRVLVTDGVLAELYDPTSGTWSATGDPVLAHGSGFTLTRLPGARALLLGGADGQLNAETYDLASGQWTALTSGPLERRAFHTATLMGNGKVLIAGGRSQFPADEFDPVCNPNGCDLVDTLEEAEIFDPVAGTFTATGSMFSPRFNHGAVLLADGRVLMSAGEGEAGSTCAFGAGVCSVSEDQCADDSQCPAGETCANPFCPECTPPFCASIGTAVFITPTLETYDPATGLFSEVEGAELGVDLTRHTSTRLSDGRVLFVGGNAQLFDPDDGTLGPTFDLINSRTRHTATLLSTGRVLVAGGQGFVPDVGLVTFAAAELFDPGQEVFNATGSMGTARKNHTATTLPNGQVLVAGGSDGSSTVLASAELYSPVSTEPTLLFTVTAISAGTLTDPATDPPTAVFAGTSFTSPISLVYTPPPDSTVSQTVEYSVTESGLVTDSAIITVIVFGDGCAAVGRPPGCAPGDSLSPPPGASTSGVVGAADADRSAGPFAGLTLAVEGEGGTVTAFELEPTGQLRSRVGCSSRAGECKRTFSAGARVTLVARPDGEHFEFLGWGGHCRGAEPVITVVVDGVSGCTALFGPKEVD